MTLARFGFNIPSFTYPGTGDADLFDTVCARPRPPPTQPASAPSCGTGAT